MKTQEQTTIGPSLREEVEERFSHDFSAIPLPLLEKAYPNGELSEHIIYPKGYDFENEDEPLYPMWGYVFEANNQFLSEKLEENVNELAEIGIYLMQVNETRVIVFITGCGYDFYDSHWLPMYRNVFKWVK